MDPLPRRSFLTALAAPAITGLSADKPETGPVLLATDRPWRLRPGSGEDQSAALQAIIDAASDQGGTVALPAAHGDTAGSYLVQGIRPRDNVLLQGLHGATLRLPEDARENLIDNAGEANLSHFVLRDLTLDGGGQDRTLLRVTRSGTRGYAWDRGGIYDVELKSATVGAEVEYAGQVYFRGGRVDHCREGLRLSGEHLYLQDVTIWGCRTGVLARELLHTHWDHVVFAHGGRESTAVRTPDIGGPHIQESRLVNCEVIDYRRGLDVRYLLDSQISRWRFKAIDFEGVRAAFSGMVELSSCRFLGCGADPSGEYSAVWVVESRSHSGWRIHSNLARDAKDTPTMKHGFDLSGLADAEDAVVGHGNHVRGAASAGYLVRPRHTMLSPAHNLGSFATA